MTNNRNIMLDKVRKLFTKATSVAGTPEADTFNAKAYELIAKYGIAETEARQHNPSTGPAEMVTADFAIRGRYINPQRALLQLIARAMHCAPLYVKNGQAEDCDIVVGAEVHVDRVRILFSMLMPQMLAGAKAVRPDMSSRVGTTTYRRSWMRGFTDEVSDRLTEAEQSATDSATAGTSLVLVDDRKRANATLRLQFAGRIVTQRSRGLHDGGAAAAGRAAGANVNLGGSAVGARRAIGA